MTAAESFKDQLALVRTFKQGEIYLADDRYVSTNLKQYFKWEEKATRPIMILEDSDRNKDRSATIIIVAPITATSPPTPLDIPIPRGTGKIQEDSVIQISLLHPIPKYCIGTYIGEVPIALKDQIRKHLLKLYGMFLMTA